MTYVLLQVLKIQRVPRDAMLRTPSVADPKIEWSEALDDLQQRPLRSSAEAAVELEMLWASVQAVMDTLNCSRTAANLHDAHLRRRGLRSQADAWDERYAALQSLPGIPKSDPASRAALGVRRTLIGILLTVHLGEPDTIWEETNWDAFHDDFVRAVEIAETVAPVKPTDDPALKTPRFMPCLMKSMLFVAKVCRQPAIRRQGLEALRATIDRARGVMTPGMTAVQISRLDPGLPVVFQMMALEEAAAATCAEAPRCMPGEYVCRMHRVSAISVAGRGRGARTVTLLTVGDLLANAPGYVSVVKAAPWF